MCRLFDAGSACSTNIRCMKKKAVKAWIELPEHWIDEGEKYGLFVVGKDRPEAGRFVRGTITYSLPTKKKRRRREESTRRRRSRHG
jgi:hypothetical protein